MVTRCEPHAIGFISEAWILANTLNGELVLGLDRCKLPEELARLPQLKTVALESKGYLESVLDKAVSACSGDYVLRLDDDETASAALENWLQDGEFADDVYTFPRLNLWKKGRIIRTPPLYPDYQTRFTTRTKAGGRNQIHTGCPFGTGTLINKPIVHHKFIVRDYDDRMKIAMQYEETRAGAGFGITYQPYNLPERSFKSLEVQDWNGMEMTGQPHRIYFGGEHG
jgi:hypothetical protein